MPASNDDGTTKTPLQISFEAYQDGFIGRALPAWLRTASVEQLTALKEAMVLSLYFNQRTRSALAGLQSIDSFTLPLLQQALGPRLDAQRLQFVMGRKEPVITSQPIGSPVTAAVYANIPLLEAALRNFNEEETRPGGYLAGNRLLDPHDAQTELPTPDVFARACRQLDLGKRYQQHLDSVLSPAEGVDEQPGEGRRRVASLIARMQRYSMLVDAHIAWIKGQLHADEHQLLVKLCGLQSPINLNDDPVIPKQLSLLGCWLEGIVVLDVRDETFSPLYTSSNRVLVYIPGDPLTPWRAYPSLRHFANDLGRRLRIGSYQNFFRRFVRRRDSQRFFSRVVSGYADVSDLANIDLHERMLAFDGRLFDSLAHASIQRIKDDAAMIAVPTSAVDREVQREHDERLAAEGWTLLNLAGLFVPVLGALLLAMAAWDLLRGVYHGVQAWREGDTHEALDHVLNVAIDLAVIAATAAGIHAVRGAWQRSTVVDSLIPAQLNDGSQRLWNQDLSAYRSEIPPAAAVQDPEGLFHLGSQAWIEMDGYYYAVRQRNGTWCLSSRNGHAPGLVHNGAGAWRLWSEQPAEWEDPYRLFRRLGRFYQTFNDQQIDEILTATNLTPDQLRALHAYVRAPDACFVDTCERFALDQRIRVAILQLSQEHEVEDQQVLDAIRVLPGAEGLSEPLLVSLVMRQRRSLFQQLYDANLAGHSDETALLRRDFPGLHARAAIAVLEAAGTAQRERLLESGRVPLPMAEAARTAVRQIRVARVYEALYLHTPQSLDLARVCLKLCGKLPGAPAGQRWRLFDVTLQGPALLAVGEGEGDRCLDMLHHAGDFQLFDDQGRSLAGPGEFFSVMAAGFDDAERDAMDVSEPFAHNLRVLLAAQAKVQRQEVGQFIGPAERIGWFRPPQRLEDGRLGYPLSGRSPGHLRRPAALSRRLRLLYPAFDDAQIERWLEAVRRSGQDPDREIVRLERELSRLQVELGRWCESLPATSSQRTPRQSLSQALIGCWQHTRGTHMYSATGEFEGYRLMIWGLRLDNLPALPESVSFEHVRQLSLRDMGLRDLPADFLRAFPNVTHLELPNNRVTQLPPNLPLLRLLRELDLCDNSIVLDQTQAQTLSDCESLEVINLSSNPLGRTFSLARMIRLRRLHVQRTGISQFPPDLLSRQELNVADLRNNAITDVPEQFYRLPQRLSSAILLEWNPLNQGTVQRLREYMLANGWHIAPGWLDIPAPAPHVVRDRWLNAVGADALAQRSYTWDQMQGTEGSQAFFQLLERLLGTVDFQHRPFVLADRVFTLLEAMGQYSGLREELFGVMNNLELTCQDSAALHLSTLELRLLVWRACYEAGPGREQSALVELGRQMWRLDQVDQAALADIQARQAAGHDPDQIEVGLAYRLELRQLLNLPGQPGDMGFRAIAGLDAQQNQRLGQQILARENNERLAESLLTRDFWLAHLKRAYASRFSAVSEPFQMRSTELMEAADTAPMRDDEYKAAQEQIKEEWDRAVAALTRTLTYQTLQLPIESRAPGEEGPRPGPSTRS
ncbi:NEL-type E3 ubiquitin ligase domain-containing protein [Pseudomonas sp. Hg5Tf]|uniref:RING-type E3 ubiquitin transferase n=1 Tax=Pseudomonas sp. Hg7Tf TaxID=3236988 RepID=A0AB39I1I7_9PSED|nr:NEL-type E3 ubiquitin ligase domain-containing protein [Pseudomonas sp. Hg5Tf]MDH2558288.1 NEL-type E3 ubiquitin ligase domain-containing protein [Pseudomonas sp. Hg5Tf]